MLPPLSAGRCQHESIRYWKAYCTVLARIAAFGRGEGVAGDAEAAAGGGGGENKHIEDEDVDEGEAKADEGADASNAAAAGAAVPGPLDSKSALQTLARYYSLLTDLLLGHSKMEDEALYVEFEKRHPGATTAPTADHEREIPLMQALCKRIQTIAAADEDESGAKNDEPESKSEDEQGQSIEMAPE